MLRGFKFRVFKQVRVYFYLFVEYLENSFPFTGVIILRINGWGTFLYTSLV
jgi:hypothetical protein